MFYFKYCVLLIALTSSGNTGTVREPERHQVVIVGAGVSGITAAVTLLEHNVTDIIVLEASDRIGGRIHTVEFGGLSLDKGAEYVHGDIDNSVYDIVKPYDLIVSYGKTIFTPEKYLYTNLAGDDLNSTLLGELLDKAYNALNDKQTMSPNSTVNDYFNSKIDDLLNEYKVDKKLGEAIRRIVPGFICSNIAADSLSQIGGSTQFNEEEAGDISYKWKPETGGYKTLFDILLKKFPDPKEELPLFNKTLFGKQVTKINLEDSKPVEVQCADGSSYLADHVIMTVSLGVLKKHVDTMFVPALPERKTAVIKAMGFGVICKIFSLFPSRWWPDGITFLTPLLSNEEIEEVKNTTVYGYWMAESLGFHMIMGNDMILETWLAGEACRKMESLSDDQVKEAVGEFLVKTLGNKFNISKPERILRSTWDGNPFTLGSYSFHSVESDKQNLSNSDLAAPVLVNNKPVLLFAGEATNTDGNFGTVHGALDTGRREANNLINYLKNNPVL